MLTKEEKINKAKKARDWRTAAAGMVAVIYIIFAWITSSDESNPAPDFLMPLSLGFGIGLFFVMFSLTLTYETTKKLIEIETKSDEILRRLSTQITEQPVASKEKSKEEPSTSIPVPSDVFPHIIDEWKLVVQTQMHFNEMIMKIRAGIVAVVYAVFGASAFVLQYNDLWTNIYGFNAHPSYGLIVIGITILFGIFYLDYKYYYRMLIGATNRADEIANEFKNFGGRKYFSLSIDIREAISKKKGASKKFVKLFYSLPIVGGFVYLAFIIVIYNIGT